MKVYSNHRGQVVGKEEKGIFRKVVEGSKHLFKSQDAWGIDSKILEDLKPETEIRILDKEDKTVYYTTARVFKTGTRADFSHGEQILLWRGLFDVSVAGVRNASAYVADWLASVDLWNSVPPLEPQL